MRSKATNRKIIKAKAQYRCVGYRTWLTMPFVKKIEVTPAKDGNGYYFDYYNQVCWAPAESFE